MVHAVGDWSVEGFDERYTWHQRRLLEVLRIGLWRKLLLLPLLLLYLMLLILMLLLHLLWELLLLQKRLRWWLGLLKLELRLLLDTPCLLGTVALLRFLNFDLPF